MERVSGIGGLFFRAHNPEALNKWYADNLGLDDPSQPGRPWAQAAGMTVWSAFERDTDYFGSREQAFMVNFRVDNLDAMLSQLRAAGAEVLDKVEDYDYGRFGWAVDPEGNRFELWEPREPSS